LSAKFPGRTGTDPEGVSERGEDFITLLADEFNGKRWFAHSGIALKDLSGYSVSEMSQRPSARHSKGHPPFGEGIATPAHFETNIDVSL
jgi:hypothetical protein